MRTQNSLLDCPCGKPWKLSTKSQQGIQARLAAKITCVSLEVLQAESQYCDEYITPPDSVNTIPLLGPKPPPG